MVLQSLTLFARSRGPDEFWRKRKIFKLAAHFVGRKRNCYSIAIKYVQRALRYATLSRKLKKADMLNLWNARLTAACAEHDLTLRTFKETLMRNNILIDKKTLVDLAIWEPRSFKSLAQLAIARGKQDGLNDVMHVKTPPGVITRGMLK